MIKVMKHKHSYLILWAVFLVVMFTAWTPLMTEHCINGHDLDYHLLRIEALKEGILSGRPFLKVNLLFLGGAGYASSMFYPDMLLYVPALLRAAGVSINTSFHLFVALCIALSYGSAFYCARLAAKSRYAGMIAGIVTVLCQYYIDDIYTRSAVGEYTAYIFLPFVLYGLYDLIYDEFRRPWLMGLGFAGVLLCHMSTFVMCMLLYTVVLLFHLKKLILDRRRLLFFLLTTVLVLLLTAFYWLPMLEQMADTTFYVATAWVNVSDTMTEVRSIFMNELPGMGAALFLLCLPRLFVKKSKANKSLTAFADTLLLSGILFALAATRLFPWERLERILNFLQFPWRLYLMASACLAIGIALLFETYLKGRKTREYALLLILALMISSAFGNLARNEEGYYSYSDDYYEHQPFTGNVIAGEWLPESVDSVKAVMAQANRVVDSEGREREFVRLGSQLQIPLQETDAAYLDVPFIYYKGYGAELRNKQDRTNTPVRVTGEGQHGFCRVYPEQGARGTLIVSYQGTALQRLSYALSLAAAGFLILVKIRRSRPRAVDKSQFKLV